MDEGWVTPMPASSPTGYLARMKGTKILVGLAIALAASVAQAYTVHFAFSEPGENKMTFLANPGAGAPWDNSTGVVTNFDVYYDPATATPNGFGEFTFHDPTKDFWSARIETTDLGVFVVTRPLDIFRSSDHGFSFSRLEYVPGDTVELLDFDAVFAEQITANYELPGALLPALPLPLTPHPDYFPPYFRLEGGMSFFPVDELELGYGYGHFNSGRAEIIGPIAPVPEPATYAFATSALLSLVLAFRHRREHARPLDC